MDIPPTPANVVRKLRDGRLVLIDDDVCGVAADLAAIDPSLRLRWAESGGRYVVYQDFGNGEHQFVFAAEECDQRIVHRAREIARPGYNYGDELERIDAERDAGIHDRMENQVGDVGERLFHALRKDGAVSRQVFVPRDVEQ